MRARLGTAAHFFQVVILKLRTMERTWACDTSTASRPSPSLRFCGVQGFRGPGLCFTVHGLWFIVNGSGVRYFSFILIFVVYGLRLIVFGLRFMVYGL